MRQRGFRAATLTVDGAAVSFLYDQIVGRVPKSEMSVQLEVTPPTLFIKETLEALLLASTGFALGRHGLWPHEETPRQ